MVLCDNRISRSFTVAQGVRQGAVLSPILYAIYTSDLLFDLESSNLGVSIDHIFVGAPTYADDMVLIASSPWALQAMLDIVYNYSSKWRYSINPNKSQIIILNYKLPSSFHFQWKLDGHIIPIVSSVKHLGILITTSPSTITRTNNSITSSRSAFYALTAIGARQACLNPCTSIHLFKTLSLPILSYGLEIWSPSSSELRMMDRSQVRILRTILGLPSRSPLNGIYLMTGTIPLQFVCLAKQLTFIRNTLALPDSAISRRIMLLRATIAAPPAASIVSSFASALDSLSLPSIVDLAADLPSRAAWKALTKTLIHEQFRESCTSSAGPSMDHILRLSLPTRYGRPVHILHSCRNNLSLARLSNLRIRFLLKATSLAKHTSCFHPTDGRVRSPICPLCNSNAHEDAIHFIALCPLLQPIRNMWIPKIYPSSPPPPDTLCDHVLGIVWIDQQDLLLKFLADLYQYRASLL